MSDIDIFKSFVIGAGAKVKKKRSKKRKKRKKRVHGRRSFKAYYDEIEKISNQ